MLKIAMVTGAGSGVGRRVSEVLSKEGIIVYLIGRRKDKLIETKELCSGQTEIMQCDVSDPTAVENVFRIIEEKHGRIDVLFNNAGIGVPARSIDEMPFEDWKSVVDINLHGMFLCAKYAFTLMRKQTPQGGRIINNGSVSSVTPRPGSIPYTATKHAVTGMTKTISLDGRKYDIACSQIDIGNAETPMTARMKEGVPQATGKMEIEPVIDSIHIAEAVLYMVNLPVTVNVPNMTVMANKMPFVGRG
ncbi:MAG: SDR family NAD(P)-dependent oxidoreductase [Proteobacteria bacterium]|nr:SDR family NAD(P)-dependent oxidoreductase [Pseudomonadota bacterium]MDA1136551.1 SDR family NAD(P)-dependent oxidoreductase [Pseudomonadota bacterium]